MDQTQFSLPSQDSIKVEVSSKSINAPIPSQYGICTIAIVVFRCHSIVWPKNVPVHMAFASISTIRPLQHMHPDIHLL